MKHGSLFSGVGGFDLAAEWMGWENVFHCEIDTFCQQVLRYYWPESISYADIKQTDFTIHRGKIDILTGGFPCQPFSAAGKRKGTEDDRHLWPQMLRAIREIAPRYIVGENVYGLVNWSGGLVFEQVQADLEAEGYEVAPVILPACSTGAPHRRDRIWFVAYCANAGVEDVQRRKNGVRGYCDASNTKSKGLEGQNGKRLDGADKPTELASTDTTKPNKQRSRIRQKQQKGKVGRSGSGANENGITSNTSGSGWLQDNKQQRAEKPQYPGTRWERFPTQPSVCSRNDGIPDRLDGITFPKWRNESIKAYGNAVVPQVVYEIFKTIELFDLQENT